MAFKCPVPGCEDSEKEFQPEAALKSHIRNAHSKIKEGARKVPIVEVDFATAELVGGKRRDIMKKVSYVICDKSALR